MGLVIPISCSDENTVGQARPMASQTLRLKWRMHLGSHDGLGWWTSTIVVE